MRYYLPRQEKYWYVLVISLVLGILWMVLIRTLLGAIFKEVPSYILMLNSSSTIRFGIGFLILICISTLCLIWFTQIEQKENEAKERETEKIFKEAELFKLRQQLQPHFLFNSLNSIIALIGSNPEKARSMIQQLSDFLRRTLKKEEEKWVDLEEEFNYLNLYLEIEKVRFGHRLSTQMILQDSCKLLKIPPLILQPVLENAIKFGLYDTIGDIEIVISAEQVKNILMIQVQNPFDPETANPQKGTGFGLSSVGKRLYLLFGRRDLLETRIEENLFFTILKIPQLGETEIIP